MQVSYQVADCILIFNPWLDEVRLWVASRCWVMCFWNWWLKICENHQVHGRVIWYSYARPTMNGIPHNGYINSDSRPSPKDGDINYYKCIIYIYIYIYTYTYDRNQYYIYYIYTSIQIITLYMLYILYIIYVIYIYITYYIYYILHIIYYIYYIIYIML